MADVLAAPHPNLTASKVVAAMRLAFRLDPTGGGGKAYPDLVVGVAPPPGGGEGFIGFVSDCQIPKPTNGQINATRVDGCSHVAGLMYWAYQANGVTAFYDAARDVYNYGVHHVIAETFDYYRTLTEGYGP